MSGNGERICFPGGLVLRGGRRRIVGCLWGLLYRYRAGIPWRDLPERFGDFRVVHTRFSRWAKRDVWKQISQCLACEADNEYPPTPVGAETPSLRLLHKRSSASWQIREGNISTLSAWA